MAGKSPGICPSWPVSWGSCLYATGCCILVIAEGISIWYSLTHGMQVQLATEFYRAMVDLPPVSGKENQQLNQAALDAFAGCFSREEGGRWQQILQGHMYYPQEILSAEVLGRVLCRYNEILA